MIDLSTSGSHVAVLLDGLRTADHHIIVGGWPSLLVVTDRVSLQLDLAEWLTRSEAAKMSGRLLSEVMRWDASIRGRSVTTSQQPLATVAGDKTRIEDPRTAGGGRADEGKPVASALANASRRWDRCDG